MTICPAVEPTVPMWALVTALGGLGAILLLALFLLFLIARDWRGQLPR